MAKPSRVAQPHGTALVGDRPVLAIEPEHVLPYRDRAGALLVIRLDQRQLHRPGTPEDALERPDDSARLTPGPLVQDREHRGWRVNTDGHLDKERCLPLAQASGTQIGEPPTTLGREPSSCRRLTAAVRLPSPHDVGA